MSFIQNPLTSDVIQVTREDSSLRLDKLLHTQFPNYSRTYFQYLIESGSVLVNGEKWKKRQKPKEGDEIEICFQLTPEMTLEPENIPLDILFEDEYLLAVNKPAGMVVHPGAGNPSGTFANALLHHCSSLSAGPDNLRPGIVHRLDKDTSGILLAAKTTQAHERLVNLFCNRQIDKRYWAVCLGNPGDVTIHAPIKRHPLKRQQMTVMEGGKEATSHCKVLARHDHYSLVEMHIISGRTHQIRVHLKHVGCPILGDPVYGNQTVNQKHFLSRQLLHAYRLSFVHPFTQASIELAAPIPADMQKFINNFSLIPA